MKLAKRSNIQLGTESKNKCYYSSCSDPGMLDDFSCFFKNSLNGDVRY